MITIKTPPVSVNSLYYGKKVLRKESRKIKEAMAWEAKSQWRKGILEDQIMVTIHFYFPSKVKSLDIDGALKGLLDCLTGVIWKDDRQIIYLCATKRIDKENPRTELIITPIHEQETTAGSDELSWQKISPIEA